MQRTAPAPPGEGAVMWWASAVEAPPRNSPRMVAPRATAASHSSSSSRPQPSEITKPSRSAANGRDVPELDRAVMFWKPANPVGVSVDSAPPATTRSHRPQAMRSAARVMPWVPAAQAVTIVSHGPCQP